MSYIVPSATVQLADLHLAWLCAEVCHRHSLARNSEHQVRLVDRIASRSSSPYQFSLLTCCSCILLHVAAQGCESFTVICASHDHNVLFRAHLRAPAGMQDQSDLHGAYVD
jgi:hypothetical protein